MSCNFCFFHQTVTYIKENLTGDIVDLTKTDEDKEELLCRDEQVEKKINELSNNIKAAEEAMNILTEM